MDGGVIEHLLALRHAQEACALLESLGAELRHLIDGLAAGEDAVLLTVGDDVLRGGLGETRHALKERGGRGVYIHADGIDAVLDDAGERLLKARLRHIVLVLADADGHGVYLDKLRERILEPARDGDSGAEVDVIVRELFGGKLRGGVDRRAGFVNDSVAQAAAELGDHLDRHLLGLARGGAVADGNMLNAVPAHKAGEDADGLGLFPGREGRVHDGGVEHLARTVDDGYLAAVAVAGVEPHCHLALDGRLHQQRAQVEGKHFYRALAGGIGKGGARLALHRRPDKAVVSIVRGGADEGHGAAAGLYDGAAHVLERKLPVKLNADPELILLLAAVYGENLVPLKLPDALAEIVIEPVDAVLIGRSFGPEHGLCGNEIAQPAADIGVIGDHLGDDIRRAGERILGGLDAFFGVYVFFGELLRFRQGTALLEQREGERLEPLLLGDGRARAALGLIRTVDILKGGEGRGFVDGVRQLIGELALLLDGFLHSVAPLLEPAQILKAFGEGAQGGVVHRAVQLLAVAGDEGDCVALVNELDDIIDMALLAAKLTGKDLAYAFQCASPWFTC